MLDRWLAGYWGELPAGCGAYGLDQCGGPSGWAVGPRPAPGAAGLLWAVPFEGRRYAFVFDAYASGDDAPFFARFRSTVPGGVLARGEDTACVYQSDTLLPGFELASGLWGGLDSDDLEGCLHCIDLAPPAHA